MFREVLLRCIMERKKCSLEKVIHDLLNCEDVMTATNRGPQQFKTVTVSGVAYSSPVEE